MQLRIGLIALMVVVLHVALSIYVSVAPEHTIPRNKITDVYKHLVVLGPFFSESRIKYSHFLSVRYKQKDTWSVAREFGKEYFLKYSQGPWRFDKLAYISYEKQLAFEVARIAEGKPFEVVKNSSAFRELNGFLARELLPQPVDSIQLIYGLDYYYPDSKTYLLDTLFAYTYNPGTIRDTKE